MRRVALVLLGVALSAAGGAGVARWAVDDVVDFYRQGRPAGIRRSTVDAAGVDAAAVAR